MCQSHEQADWRIIWDYFFFSKSPQTKPFWHQSEHLLQRHSIALHYGDRCSCYFVHPVRSIFSVTSCHKERSVLTAGSWRTQLWGVDVIWSNHWHSDFLTLFLQSAPIFAKNRGQISPDNARCANSQRKLFDKQVYFRPDTINVGRLSSPDTPKSH